MDRAAEVEKFLASNPALANSGEARRMARGAADLNSPERIERELTSGVSGGLPIGASIEEFLTYIGGSVLVRLDPIKKGGMKPLAGLAEAKPWNDRGHAVYFHLNRLPSGFGGKAKKENISAIRAVCGDIDWDKMTFAGRFDEGHAKVMETAERLKTIDTPPTVIIGTGGGIQPIWMFEIELTPTPETTARVERLGKAVRAKFGGDAVQNIDRVLRCPGFTNHPNEDKRDAGQPPRMAEIIFVSGKKYTLEALEAAFPPANGYDAGFGAAGATRPAKGSVNDELTGGFDEAQKQSLVFAQFADAVDFLVVRCKPSPLARTAAGGEYNNWFHLMSACAWIASQRPEHGPDAEALIGSAMGPLGRVPEINWLMYHRVLNGTLARIAAGKTVITPSTIFGLATEHGWSWHGGAGAAGGGGTGALPPGGGTQPLEDPEDAEGVDFIDLPTEFDDKEMTPPKAFGALRETHDYIMAASVYPQPAFACGAALFNASSIIGNEFRIEASGDMRLNIYTLLVGPTSAGKDGPLAASRAYLKSFTKHFDGIASTAALQDNFFRYPGMPQIYDEASSLMAAMNNVGRNAHYIGLSETLLTIFSRSNGEYTERSFATDRSKKVGKVSVLNSDLTAGVADPDLRRIQNPYFSALWAATPTTLGDAMKGLQSANGLMNRILYFSTTNHLPTKNRTISKAVPPSIDAWGAVVRQAGPTVIRIAPGVKAVLDNDRIRDRVDKWSSKKSEARLAGDVVARLTELTLKVAGIAAVCRDCQNPVIDDEIMAWAFRVAWWSCQHLFSFAASNVADTLDEAIFKRIQKALERKLRDEMKLAQPPVAGPGWLRHSETLKASKVIAKRFDEAIVTMIASGAVGAKERSSGGRKGVYYRLLVKKKPSGGA